MADMHSTASTPRFQHLLRLLLEYSKSSTRDPFTAVPRTPELNRCMRNLAQLNAKCSQISLNEVTFELQIFDRLLYKNHNQHRSSVYFHRLQETSRLFHRFLRINWVDYFTLSQRTINSATPVEKHVDLPSLKSMIPLSFYYATLSLTITALTEKLENTYSICRAMLANTFFMPFMLTSMAMLAKFHSKLQPMITLATSLAKLINQFAGLVPKSEISDSSWLSLTKSVAGEERLLKICAPVPPEAKGASTASSTARSKQPPREDIGARVARQATSGGTPLALAAPPAALVDDEEQTEATNPVTPKKDVSTPPSTGQKRLGSLDSIESASKKPRDGSSSQTPTFKSPPAAATPKKSKQPQNSPSRPLGSVSPAQPKKKVAPSAPASPVAPHTVTDKKSVSAPASPSTPSYQSFEKPAFLMTKLSPASASNTSTSSPTLPAKPIPKQKPADIFASLLPSKYKSK